ncbi:MAG: hypothetical protein NT018_14540 [Armatimonadetes bacterium]|nr:hypothetical protein [Armatimonadota bacterium]
MSGYGLLTQYCAEIGIASYCLEFNRPQHLWQLLCHPANANAYCKSIDLILESISRWPQHTARAAIAVEWFPEESRQILHRLLNLSVEVVDCTFDTTCGSEDLALALITPFVGRLSCCAASSNLGTHTKEGGLCIYNGWQDDYHAYLLALKRRLQSITEKAKSTAHIAVLGDARTYPLPERRFKAMVSSPPYPNRHDYASMFQVELAFLDWAASRNNVVSDERIIGTNFISGREAISPKTSKAQEFLSAIASDSHGKQADYHDRIYYIPYYEQYFADIERAYFNVSRGIADDFEGYIVVANNAHRNLIVPVAEVIIEIWNDLGFNASISEAEETYHVGTMNPRARGHKARQTEYVIKVVR